MNVPALFRPRVLTLAIQFVGAWTMVMVRRRTAPLHARCMVCTALVPQLPVDLMRWSSP